MDPLSAPSHDAERGLPLLDFPYEIYKMILVLILTPGTVYPQVGHQYDLQQDVDLKASQPGFQILATCKRIYSDGFPIFYGKNEFCLPRGKKENAESYFLSLAPEHGTLIRRMAIKHSITDIDGSFLREHELQRGLEDDGDKKETSMELAIRRPSRAIPGKATDLWMSKHSWVYEWHLNQIFDGIPGLFNLRLENGNSGRALNFSGCELTEIALQEFSHRYLDAAGQKYFIPPYPIVMKKLRAYHGVGGYSLFLKARLEFQESEDRRSWKDGFKEWLEELRRAEDIERLS